MNSKIKNILILICFVLVTLLIGGISGFLTAPEITTWYVTLAKPFWNPPNWLFGPVWTTLYILMGAAAYLVWKEGFKRKDVKIALGLFSVQIILNFFWSIIFFSYQNIFLALIEIIILWIAILATIISFYRISRPAAALMIPYILWVTIATFLNYNIWILN